MGTEEELLLRALGDHTPNGAATGGKRDDGVDGGQWLDGVVHAGRGCGGGTAHAAAAEHEERDDDNDEGEGERVSRAPAHEGGESVSVRGDSGVTSVSACGTVSDACGVVTFISSVCE